MFNFQILNSSYEINDTINYPFVRVFYVQDITSDDVLYDLKGIATPWSVPTPSTVDFFQKLLQFDKLNMFFM